MEGLTFKERYDKFTEEFKNEHQAWKSDICAVIEQYLRYFAHHTNKKRIIINENPDCSSDYRYLTIEGVVVMKQYDEYNYDELGDYDLVYLLDWLKENYHDVIRKDMHAKLDAIIQEIGYEKKWPKSAVIISLKMPYHDGVHVYKMITRNIHKGNISYTQVGQLGYLRQHYSYFGPLFLSEVVHRLNEIKDDAIMQVGA